LVITIYTVKLISMLCKTFWYILEAYAGALLKL